MRTIIAIAFLVFSCDAVIAQDTLLSHPVAVDSTREDKGSDFLLSAYSFGTFYSDGIGARWMREWIKGGEISRASNQKQRNHLDNFNSSFAHYGTQVSIDASLFPDSVSTGEIEWRAGFVVGQNTVVRSQYNGDAFQLLFLGNKGLNGQELSWNHLQLESFQYRQMGLNIYRSNFKNFQFWNAGLQWVESSAYDRYSSPYANIGFSNAMDTVHIDYLFRHQQLKDNQKGIGFCTNVQWESLKGPVQWHVHVYDLGWIHYKGLKTDQFKGNGNFTGLNANVMHNLDSLQQFLNPYSVEKQYNRDRWVALPTQLYASITFFDHIRYSYQYFFGGQWGQQSIGWITHMPRSGYVWILKGDLVRTFQDQWGVRYSAQWNSFRGMNVSIMATNWLRTGIGNAHFFSGGVQVNIPF